MKKTKINQIAKRVLVILIVALLCFSCGCNNGDNNSVQGSSNQQSAVSSGSQPTGDVSSSSSSSDEGVSADSSSTTSSGTESKTELKKSQKPFVTVASQVGNGVCVVAGYCSKDTERIIIRGTYARSTTTVPFAGKDKKYFMAQVPYTAATSLSVTAVEKNATESDSFDTKVGKTYMEQNYMYRGEYSPVFGKDSQMHFYSALLSYSLNTDKLTSRMLNSAYSNISSIVSEAKNYGAETIFVIIPSSADIYPETVPDEYYEASGERLYERFAQIAKEQGAKVIYPIGTMLNHKNDGVGYQLYQHTDSHWSTYGAYWGTYDLFDYISKKFPNAKPRTLSEMKFYTTEMHGGDALFSFPKQLKFEDYYGDKTTKVTQIKELTTRYKLNMPTSTLKKVYKNDKCLSLTEDNAGAAKVVNPNGKGLPTALIMRDSFSKVSYDMMNDRFSAVYWGEFNNYNMPLDLVDTNKLDYVIYVYSERNLLKIMMNSAEASILNLQ